VLPWTAGTVTERQRKAHLRWLEEGQQGEGQLDLQDRLLIGTRLGARNLRAARFARCRLEAVDLASARLQGASFTDCELDFSGFLMARIQDTTWRGCSVVGGLFGASHGDGIELVECVLSGAEIERARWPRARLIRTGFVDANLRGIELASARLWGCDLRGADLAGADLSGATLNECDLRGANLECANLDGLTLQGGHRADAAPDGPESPDLVGLTVRSALRRLGPGVVDAAHTLRIDRSDGTRWEAQLTLDRTIASEEVWPADVVAAHGEEARSFVVPPRVAMAMRRFRGHEPLDAADALGTILCAYGAKATLLWKREGPEGTMRKAWTFDRGGVLQAHIDVDGGLLGLAMRNGLLGLLERLRAGSP
jgi:uncharacterized protein YjbI with pentapeptide repeats